MTLDLNADAGESFGNWNLGNDEALFALVTSANLACGFHAGDPLTMQVSVDRCRRLGVAAGAHPGFSDLVGFGRRDIAASPEEIYADVLYQLGALAAMLSVAGLPMHHCKAHGALYQRAMRNPETAGAIAQAVLDFDPTLPVVVFPGTPLESVPQQMGLRTVAEAFPERGYTQNGMLAPRHMQGAVIHDPAQAAARAVQMLKEGAIPAVDGGFVEVRFQTLCIHGDNPQAPAIAHAVRQALAAEGVSFAAF